MVHSVKPYIGRNKEDGLVYFQISDQVLYYTKANCKLQKQIALTWEPNILYRVNKPGNAIFNFPIFNDSEAPNFRSIP